jgi:hypothetical protein
MMMVMMEEFEVFLSYSWTLGAHMMYFAMWWLRIESLACVGMTASLLHMM